MNCSKGWDPFSQTLTSSNPAPSIVPIPSEKVSTRTGVGRPKERTNPKVSVTVRATAIRPLNGEPGTTYAVGKTNGLGTATRQANAAPIRARTDRPWLADTITVATRATVTTSNTAGMIR